MMLFLIFLVYCFYYKVVEFFLVNIFIGNVFFYWKIIMYLIIYFVMYVLFLNLDWKEDYFYMVKSFEVLFI